MMHFGMGPAWKKCIEFLETRYTTSSKISAAAVAKTDTHHAATNAPLVNKQS